MNDPHVVSLQYRIDHDLSVDYSEAEAVEDTQTEFDVRVHDDEAEFTMKVHCATVEEAQGMVEPYIHDWEFETSLERGRNTFSFRFVRAEVVDRNPTTGTVSVSGHVVLGAAIATASLCARTPYPPPPSGNMCITPEVSIMHERYLRYREGRESLASMANFCLTVVEELAGVTKQKRPRAAEKFGIAQKVLSKIGDLADAKGGSEARKAKGMHESLSDKEQKFLKVAIQRLIRRVAEVNHSANAKHPQIQLSELPPL